MTQELTKLKRNLLIISIKKCITTPKFNTSAAEHFAAISASANLITKTDFDAKVSSLNKN